MAEGKERLSLGLCCQALYRVWGCIHLEVHGSTAWITDIPGKGALNLVLALRGAVFALHGMWLVDLPCGVMLAFVLTDNL